MRVTQWIEEFVSDVRFGWRQLLNAPGFCIVAALTLGLAPALRAARADLRRTLTEGGRSGPACSGVTTGLGRRSS